MKHVVTTTFHVTAKFDVDAEYTRAATEQAERMIREGIEAFLPRCGVAFDNTEANADYGDD